ncbi:MAG: TetR/AcrR family transcriptional regulator [Desulfomonilaceae bacterium]
MKNERVAQVSPVESSSRQRIVAAARRHFFAYGFRAVTMDDLARELGMSKKTLYAHFPSKTWLLEAVLLNKSRDVEKDLELITSNSSSDFLVALHLLLEKMQEHLDELQPPFMRDMQKEGPETFKLVETRRRELIQRYFATLIEDGQKAGIIRNDIPTTLVVEIWLAATQAIMNPPKLAELGFGPKTGFSALITVIFEGVLTEGGRSKL